MWFGLGRSAGYILIFLGLALLASVIPSAAGPPDAIGAARLGGVPFPGVSSAARTAGGVPAFLIASSRRAGATREESPTAAPSTATATAEPTPAAPPTPEPAPAPPTVLPPTDRIIIPRIQLDAKVVNVGVLPSGEMETAAYAAGRLDLGADAGEAGNVVLAGHNDIQGEVFRRLPELQVGNDLTLYRGEQAFTYRVEVRTIVREDGATAAQRVENARWLEATDDAVATLISCYPYRVDTHRIIVRARLVA